MYYLRVAGVVYGPYSDEQLRGYIAEGRVVPQSEISTDGQNWGTAGAIPGLFSSFPPMPPMSPMPSAFGYPAVTGEAFDPNKTFFGYYKECWKKSMTMRGRARRQEYWSWTVFNTLWCFLLVIPLFVCAAIAEESGAEVGPALIVAGLFGLAFFLFCLAAICPGICVTVRRLHDINASGWLALLLFVPSLNSIFALIIGLVDGSVGPNYYGSDPKGRG